MQFDIKEWRRIYDEVKARGNIIYDSLAHVGEKWEEIPVKQEISVNRRLDLEEEISFLLSRSNIYLDSCNMICKPVLWKYNKDDKSTWASHPSFRFKHLVSNSYPKINTGINRC